MIDRDTARCPSLRRLLRVLRMIGVRPVAVSHERTRNGWHLVAELHAPLSPAEIVAAQACAGSDWKREALNLFRVRAIRRTPIRSRFWRARWNLLFSEKL